MSRKEKNVKRSKFLSLVLRIDAKRMHVDGYRFYCSANNVWLTDEVPAKYIRLEAAL
jgi:RNA:NAD 2'-phosphotransferase (TPT1/KptA family)